MAVERRSLSRRSVWTAKACSIAALVLYAVLVLWLAPRLFPAGRLAPVAFGVAAVAIGAVMVLIQAWQRRRQTEVVAREVRARDTPPP